MSKENSDIKQNVPRGTIYKLNKIINIMETKNTKKLVEIEILLPIYNYVTNVLEPSVRFLPQILQNLPKEEEEKVLIQYDELKKALCNFKKSLPQL